MKVMVRILLLIFLIAMPLGTTHASGQLFFMENPNVGQVAPDFTLDTLKAKNVNLTKFRDGKSAIVFFWATWCPHCRTALKELNIKAAQFEGKGIKLVIIDIGESAGEVKAHLAKNKIDFDVFLDEESSLSEPYGIIGVPTFYFLDDQGVVKAVEHSIPDNYEEILLKKKVSKD